MNGCRQLTGGGWNRRGLEVTDLPPSDLTPRPTRSAKDPRRVWWILGVLLITAGIVIVLVRTLDEASLFFFPVDEAVEMRSELGDQRFRVLGNPKTGLVETVYEGMPVVVFTLCSNDVLADVVHNGDPAELFRPGVPVVLQGVWRQGAPPLLNALLGPAEDGWYLRTDHMVVKHDNDYRASGAELESCGTVQ